MIGWLQGRLAEPWQQANRFGVLLVCHGVGYEVQLSQRHWQLLPPAQSDLVLHVHHSIREDGSTLYGFASRHERDLFRELVAVSGVGPQMALGLLGVMQAGELVRAIVQADLRRLVQAPGVGKRTAERLSVELRSRLQERFGALVDAADLGSLDPDGLAMADLDLGGAEGAGDPSLGSHREEVHLTLAALGYETLEIHRALRAVARQGMEADGADDWIRACLHWLARSVA
jgi:Holliday junction DNA helicase RuvA